jgi:quinol monooxygenase YgiN
MRLIAPADLCRLATDAGFSAGAAESIELSSGKQFSLQTFTSNHTAASLHMTTISPSRKLVTLINVFTVEPANQQELIELLARATETSVRHAPGFISASLHRGLDGTKVTMYAQWRSVEDYQAMRENPAQLPYLQRALAIAKFDPGMYEVVESYSGTAPEF